MIFDNKLLSTFLMLARVLRRFRDPNRVPRIRENYHRVPKIRENRVPRIREIGSLQIQTGFLTFSLKNLCQPSTFCSSAYADGHREAEVTLKFLSSGSQFGLLLHYPFSDPSPPLFGFRPILWEPLG